jgi:TPR repeat protein
MNETSKICLHEKSSLERRLFLLAAILFLTIFPAYTENKVALVIGNGSYRNVTVLNNPKNDALDIAVTLQELGFTVIPLIDGDYAAMDSAIVQFSDDLKGAEVGLFYYAGHGIQHNGFNYLLPIDVKIEAEFQIKQKAINVTYVLDAMESAGVPLNIVILDACRDNPLNKGGRSIGGTRGLTVTEAAPQGTIIAYATDPGGIALDGEGTNGIFTAALLKHIITPGIDVKEMFDRVGSEVSLSTRSQQNPWVSSKFYGKFYFAGEMTQPTPKPSDEKDNPHSADGVMFLAKSMLGAERYEAAAGMFLLAANEFGSSEAQLLLGAMYHEGKGVTQDYIESEKWFRKSAEQGNAVAQRYLGQIYEEGRNGIPQNYFEAIKWFRLAADQGDAEAQYSIGSMFRKGIGLSQDYAEAMKWYRLAANQDNSNAQFYLGVFYDEGWGVAQDFREALKWYSLAAHQKLPAALYNLGVLYYYGRGVDKDIIEALKWFKIAEAQGSDSAKNAISIIIPTMNSAEISEAEHRADIWLQSVPAP